MDEREKKWKSTMDGLRERIRNLTGFQGEQEEKMVRPARTPDRQYRKVSTKALYIALGVLCVILVLALAGEEYYRRHTYEKGELAQLGEGEEKQRLRFLGNQQRQRETADPDAEQKRNVMNTQGMTMVETAESVNLKNQLIGILPGIQGPGQTAEELIAQADHLADMYDFDAAIALLENCTSYKENFQMQDAVKDYQAAKEKCVEHPVEQVTHISFQTLIKDPSRAFDGDDMADGYNQNMVTIDEFNAIIEQMYEKGYVMVSMRDMAVAEQKNDGTVTVTTQKIMLPKSKKPFVLSQESVNYYHYMEGDGFASRLVLDENGDVKAEYINEDGSTMVGDYDLVPLIDRFVEKHPDFSYRGSKGYLAVTGYDGVLGYRTDISYKTRENLDNYQAAFFEEHPDFSDADYERECSECRKVAEALREDGWLFASNTWGHIELGENVTDWYQFREDTDKWEERVEPLIGETDALIYAFGGDIGNEKEYAGDRYEYLSSRGFHYFCGMDSARYWVQIRGTYVRQARRMINGYRMYYNPDLLEDLFDVSEVWDSRRPAHVPPI